MVHSSISTVASFPPPPASDCSFISLSLRVRARSSQKVLVPHRLTVLQWQT